MDDTIIMAVNGFVGRSPAVDSVIGLFTFNDVAKTMTIPILFLYLWFAPSARTRERRTALVATLGIAVAAIAVGRGLALTLPFRERPVRSGLDLVMPAGFDGSTVLDGWTSMPSDHAVLFFALAAAFWTIHRVAGAVMLAQALVSVALGRVYFGLHWPGDVAAGALVGVIVVLVAMPPARALVTRSGVLDWGERHPQWGQPILFVALFQITTMFNSARGIVEGVVSRIL